MYVMILSVLILMGKERNSILQQMTANISHIMKYLRVGLCQVSTENHT